MSANVCEGRNIENPEKTSNNSIVSANVMGFTPAQYQQLLPLLGKDKQSDSVEDNMHLKSAYVASKMCFLSSFSQSWIIDSGATDHMCCDLSYFSSHKGIQGTINYIVIPNGKQVLVTHTGTVQLDKKLSYCMMYCMYLISSIT